MDQFYNRGAAIGAFINITIRNHFGHQENEHRAHLLPLAINNEMGDTV